MKREPPFSTWLSPVHPARHPALSSFLREVDLRSEKSLSTLRAKELPREMTRNVEVTTKNLVSSILLSLDKNVRKVVKLTDPF